MRLLPLVAIAFVSPAWANTYAFDTGVLSLGGQTQTAEAQITTGANTVTVDLFNLVAGSQIVSVIQNLSGLEFTLSSTPSSASVSSSSAPVQTPDGVGNGFGDVAGTGKNPITGTTVAGTDPVQWALSQSAATIELDGLGNGTQGPAQTIIGKADSNGDYPNANPSIAGNSPHNPFVYYQAHFVLNVAGINANTSVSSVDFRWGTNDTFDTSDSDLVPTPFAATPEPRWYTLLLVSGLALLVFFRKRTAAN